LNAVYQGFIGVYTDFNSTTTYNAVLWSMKYELLGSFMVFAFCLLVGKTRVRFPIYIVLLLVLMQTYFSAFVLGMLLSDLHNNQTVKSWIARFRYKEHLALVILFLGLYSALYPAGTMSGSHYVSQRYYGFFDPRFALPVVTLGTTLLALAVLLSENLKTTLSQKFFGFLGNISYSVYLIHLPLICSFSSWVFLVLVQRHPYDVSVGITALLSGCLLLPLSYLYYRYIDSNGIRLANWFYGWVKRCARARH
jgi:peptidoglycan/LPS O-acetylase OafA/YrhL